VVRGGAPPPLAEPGWPTLPAAQYQHTIVASWLTCAACAAAASGQGAEMVGQALLDRAMRGESPRAANQRQWGWSRAGSPTNCATRMGAAAGFDAAR
jgi:hypothetical protein